MTVLSAQSIRKLGLVAPLVDRTIHDLTKTSYGLSSCGYDVRLDQSITLERGEFVLASTIEQFRMTDDVVGIVHDKSTWARRGIAVQNTVIEPAWTGYLTLELTNHGPERLILPRGTPIAQILFHYLDRPTDQPYNGKYQNQERGPQPAR
jgi:dCTP deaminase